MRWFLAKYFTKEKNVVTRQVAQETVIVPISDRVANLDSIFTLNEVGTTIWQHLDGEKSIDQIIAAVVDEFDVSTEQATRDVNEFIEQLQGAGLVELCRES